MAIGTGYWGKYWGRVFGLQYWREGAALSKQPIPAGYWGQAYWARVFGVQYWREGAALGAARAHAMSGFWGATVRGLWS